MADNLAVVVKFWYGDTQYRVNRREDGKYVIRAKGQYVEFEEPRNIFQMFGSDVGKWVCYVETILLKESMNEVFRKFNEGDDEKR